MSYGLIGFGELLERRVVSLKATRVLRRPDMQSAAVHVPHGYWNMCDRHFYGFHFYTPVSKSRFFSDFKYKNDEILMMKIYIFLAWRSKSNKYFPVDELNSAAWAAQSLLVDVSTTAIVKAIKSDLLFIDNKRYLAAVAALVFLTRSVANNFTRLLYKLHNRSL